MMAKAGPLLLSCLLSPHNIWAQPGNILGIHIRIDNKQLLQHHFVEDTLLQDTKEVSFATKKHSGHLWMDLWGST